MATISIDTDKLRDYLEDYFGTAMFSGFPMAVIDLSKIRNASDEELIRIAQKEHIDLTRFSE